MGPQIYDININEAEVALRMLARTRELLDGGRRWRAEKMATGRLGFSCDPLSERASHFSLVGAAVRARWEFREELAQATAGEIRIVHILRAMSADQQTPYSGQLGWRHIETILDGLETALREYGDAWTEDDYSRQA